MPSQREIRILPYPFLSVGGANQRVRATELKSEEYANLQGVFPEFANLQGRIFGKRLLDNFHKSLYSIYQFWTPMGYGAGLFQSNTLDYGPWDPTGGPITIDPPTIGMLPGGGTIPELGEPDPPGSGCVIEFTDAGSIHIECPIIRFIENPDTPTSIPTPKPTKCYWGRGGVSELGMPGMVNPSSAALTDETFVDGPPPVGPAEIEKSPSEPAPYNPGAGAFAWYASCAAYSYQTNLGGGAWRTTQGTHSECTKAGLNLTGIVDPANPPASIEFQVRHGDGVRYGYTFFWQDSGVSPYQCVTQNSSVPIDMWAYCKPGFYKHFPNPLGGGFIDSDFVILTAMRLHYTGRICV